MIKSNPLSAKRFVKKPYLAGFGPIRGEIHQMCVVGRQSTVAAGQFGFVLTDLAIVGVAPRFIAAADYCLL
jgi:hypothetical protein